MTIRLVLIGDTHRSTTSIEEADRRTPAGVPFLHVGDLEYTPETVALWTDVGATLSRRMYFIRGNWDLIPLAWRDEAAPVQIAHQLVYVPDGVVLSLGGLRVGVVGGATSIDRRDREPLGRWDPNEGLRPAELARAMAMGPVDLLVTHSPPQDIVERLPLSKQLLRHFGVPLSFRDPVAAQVEAIRAALGNPPIVSGHMHSPFASPELGAYVVGMDQVLPWPVPNDADLERRHQFP